MELLRHNAWQVSIGRFVLLIVAASLVGLATGQVQLALLVALAGYVAMSLRSLYRIQHWLGSRRRVPPPEDWGVWSDVAHTVHRRLEQERSRKRRLVRLLRAFREAAAVLPDGVVITTLGREVVWFNEAAGRLLGLHPRLDRGARLDRLFEHPRLQAWLAEPGFPEPLIDVPAPRDDAMRLSLRLIPYTRQLQLLVTRDITNLMRLEQVRRDFVANVSHELRTPLTVLHGYLDMIDPQETPEWAPMVEEMRRQSLRMAQIVEDLLTLSRLEAQVQVAPEQVVMASMLKTLQREAEALSHGRHRIVMDARTTADLSGSTKDLHSAFSNLVSNAVRYTPAGGQVTIAWWATTEGEVEFSVTDTGVGIPQEHLPRITERFYRVSASRSRDSGGTGLGLSIVKHVLNLHRGRLEISSDVGRGSVFACRFDAAQVWSEPAREHAA